MRKSLKIFTFLALLAVSINAFGCEIVEPSSSSTISESSSSVEQEKKLTLLDGWVGLDEGVYTVETGDTTLDVDYLKTTEMGDFAWSALVKDIDEDLTEYKTLRFTVSGMAMMKLKLEGTKGNAEVDIAVSAIETAYEWNLMPEAEKLSGIQKIVIFGHPEKRDGAGNIHFSKFEFTSMTADGDAIINTGFNNIPSDVNEYDGTGDTFSFNAKWADNGDGVYTFEEVSEGVKVNYNKGDKSWAYIKSKIFGDFSNFNYVTLKVKGEANTRFLLKVKEPNSEVTCKIEKTGVEQVCVYDIGKNLTAEDRAGMRDILIFVAPGTTNVTGSITITGAYFTNVNENPVEEPDVNVYNGTDAEFDINHNWHDAGGLDYTVTVDGTDTVINYDKAGEWSAAKTLVQGNLGDFKYIVFKVVGAAEGKVMLKVEEGSSKVEKSFDLTGEIDELILDISILTKEVRDTLKAVYLIAAPGSKTSGTVTIKEAYFTNEADPGTPDVIVHEYNGSGIDFNINNNWYDSGDKVYSVAKSGSDVIISFDKKQTEWSTVYSPVTGKLSDFVAITAKIQGEAGKQVLIKLDAPANKEYWIDLTGEVQDISLDLTIVEAAKLDEVKKVLIFGNPGVKEVTGELTIKEMKFVRNVAKYESGDSFEVVNDWFDFDGIYTIVNGETTEVTFQKEEGKHEWACILTLVEGDFSEFTKVVFNIEGAEGKNILLKVEGTAGAHETPVTMTGTAANFELDISTFAGRHGINKVLIFADPGTPGTSGSFTINSVTFKK